MSNLYRLRFNSPKTGRSGIRNENNERIEAERAFNELYAALPEYATGSFYDNSTISTVFTAGDQWKECLCAFSIVGGAAGAASNLTDESGTALTDEAGNPLTDDPATIAGGTDNLGLVSGSSQRIELTANRGDWDGIVTIHGEYEIGLVNSGTNVQNVRLTIGSNGTPDENVYVRFSQLNTSLWQFSFPFTIVKAFRDVQPLQNFSLWQWLEGSGNNGTVKISRVRMNIHFVRNG